MTLNSNINIILYFVIYSFSVPLVAGYYIRATISISSQLHQEKTLDISAPAQVSSFIVSSSKLQNTLPGAGPRTGAIHLVFICHGVKRQNAPEKRKTLFTS